MSAILLLAVPLLGAAPALDDNTKRAVVVIARYADDDTYLGRGSGFFVDEGIVVTNKHVIEDADWYRVIATSDDYEMDFTCTKNVTKSDMKVNLDDDVAYVRVFLPCEHGVIRFADDPADGTPVWALGYPRRDTEEEMRRLSATSGYVLGESDLGWLRTDAALTYGNSGGPIVSDNGVVGVAVAGGFDGNGEYTTGFFIQSTVVVEGLLYANDSRFAYTPQDDLPSQRTSSSSSSASSRSTSSSSRSSSSSSSRSSASSRSRSSSSRVSPPPLVGAFEIRTCQRVVRRFADDRAMLDRVNARLWKRFGFACSVS